MKAYILKTSNVLSIQYAKQCSDSCDAVGMPWKYVEWFDGGTISAKDAWDNVIAHGLQISRHDPRRIRRSIRDNKAQCATSGHVRIWQMISKTNEPGLILEHDSIVLHPISIDIPDDVIAVAGYKLENYHEYDAQKAGPPKEIVPIQRHEGAHAYVVTPKTATALLSEIEKKGILGAIDNTHFLNTRKTSIPLAMISPTPAIAWIRESTIWNKSAKRNYEFIPSFREHLKV